MATPSVSASPAPATVRAANPGHYQGTGEGSIVSINELSLGGQSLATGDIGPGSFDVDSQGDPRSHAVATNVDVNLLDALDLEDLLVIAEQTAPPDNDSPDEETFLSLPLSPIVTAGVGNATAWARWPGDDRCVAPDEPVADSTTSVAGLTLLPGPDVLQTIGPDVIGTDVALFLPSQPGTGDLRSVQARGVTATVPLSLLGIGIEVLATPTITATATGFPGGATVEHEAPIVRVTPPGADPIVLDAENQSIPIDIPGVLSVVISLGEFTSDTTDDGTHAEGHLSLIHITASVVGGTVAAADIELLPMTVSATAPAGGVDCGGGPLDNLSKSSSNETVHPGDSFTYTINVPNDDTGDPPCTLTDVRVVDVITFDGPSGSVVTATSPPGATVEGLTVTWEGLGPIAPGESIDLTITVKTPANAEDGQSYDDTVTASALCDDEPTDNTFTLLDIPKISVIARTGGGGSGLYFGAGLGAVGLALLLLRRRASAIV